MTHAHDPFTIQVLKHTSLGLDRRVGHQGQHPPHHPVPLGTAIVVGYLGRLFPAGTGSDPGRKLFRATETTRLPPPPRRSPGGRNRCRSRVLRLAAPPPRGNGGAHRQCFCLASPCASRSAPVAPETIPAPADARRRAWPPR